ncbi:MAG: flagellar biosynthesis protein FlhG [Clostridia bacterium]|nr:flagellar biosynthesis protein FlhG [Clostridia bacterium]
MDQAARLRKLTLQRQGNPMRVIAVASGKGGVGKTSIVLNLGLMLARQGQKVLIFDADLGLANVDVLMGILPKHSISEVIDGKRPLEEIAIKGPHDLLLIPGASGIQQLADLDSVKRSRLINELNSIASKVNYLLIDLGAGISRNVISFAAAAGEVIVVATPEPTSITDAYALIKCLHRLNVKVNLLINRAIKDSEGRQVTERLQEACKRFLKLEVSILGVIPEDPKVAQSVRNQKPFCELYPNSKATRALSEVTAKLQGKDKPLDKKVGFWMRLSRLLGS